MSNVAFGVRRRDLAWAVALVVLLGAVWMARGDQAEAGEGPPPPPGEGIAVVYVAVGTNFPDALGVGPGGGVNNAPIIVVPTNPPLPGPTQAELIRLDPRVVVIIGGTAVVSAAMETALGALLPNATITRIGGANRYETNALFSQASFPVETWIAVPAAAFTAYQPDVEIAYAGFLGGNASTGVMYAPIHLPHGSQVLEIRAQASDTNPGVDFQAGLYRVDISSAVLMGTVSTTGDSGIQTLTTSLVSSELIDNSAYAYTVHLQNAFSSTTFFGTFMVRVRLGTP